MGRIKCDILDRAREKALTRIATRGVVKFFNVCSDQQKNIEMQLNEVGSSQRKRDKILSSIDKGSFLDKLKSKSGGAGSSSRNKKKNSDGSGDEDGENDNASNGADASSEDDDDQKKNKKAGGPGWNVLRSDFIMGGQIKDWDKDKNKSDDDHSDSPAE